MPDDEADGNDQREINRDHAPVDPSKNRQHMHARIPAAESPAVLRSSLFLSTRPPPPTYHLAMRRVLLIPTIVLLLLGTLCFFVSTGQSFSTLSQSPDPTHRPVVFCNADDTKTLDPGKSSWANDLRVDMGLWEGLTSYHPITLEPLPGVAEKWDISPDGRTYTFHLRADARWSNGEIVTSKDFIYAWKRLLEPSTGAQYGELLNCIQGVAEYAAAIEAHRDESFKARRRFFFGGCFRA